MLPAIRARWCSQMWPRGKLMKSRPRPSQAAVRKIIIMSNQKDTKCEPLFPRTSEMRGGLMITSVTHPLRHTFLTSNTRYFLRLSPSFNSTKENLIRSCWVESYSCTHTTCFLKTKSSNLMIRHEILNKSLGQALRKA